MMFQFGKNGQNNHNKMAKRNLQCIITGSKYTFGKEYYAKKIEEFDSEDNLKRFFITKKAHDEITNKTMEYFFNHTN